MKLLYAVVLTAALGSSLNAGMIITSFPQTTSGAFTLNGSPPINDAAGFTMGGSAFQLDSVTTRFATVGIASFASNLIFADLYGGTAGGSGVPTGSPLVGLTTGAATIVNDTELVYTPASAFTLQANTTYWIVLHASDAVGGNLGWAIALNPASGPFAVSEGGAQASGLPPATHNGNANLMYEVDGTAVTNNATPEPGTTVLLAAGVIVLAIRRRIISPFH